MFDEPDENNEEIPQRPQSPADRAREKVDELRTHAQLVATFEGPRKFDAQLLPNLNPDLARQVQRTIAHLDKSKPTESPIIPQSSASEAAELLKFPETHQLSTNDYHLYRRPGEVMIVRWLAGDQVETFYQRLQAHFDAAINAYRQEERQSHEWKQDPQTLAYLDALDKIEIKMPDRFLRNEIRTYNLFVLSTQSADEIDILYLADYIMGVDAAEIVGDASAPPDQPTEQDRAWFFKLFSLRGLIDSQERMCFFTYLQKTDDSPW